MKSRLAYSMALVLLQTVHAQDSGCPSHGGRSCYAATDDIQSTKEPLEKHAAIEAAYRFLYAQMDMYHRSTVVYAEPAYADYYPSGWMGDSAALTIDPAETNERRCGKTSLRIQYDPKRQVHKGWAGVRFQYPPQNWGELPGRDLTGATKLTAWVHADRNARVKFTAGGTSGQRHRDALNLERFHEVNQCWTALSVDLSRTDLHSVISPFGIVIAAADVGAQPLNLYLDDISIDRARLEEPRFVQSYLPKCYPMRGAANTAHTYDQALVLLAFLARATPEDMTRAEQIAQALVMAQNQDRAFDDGRLRNAYASGELVDPTAKVTRLPGQYVEAQRMYVEDEFAAGSDTGNMAWAGLALVQAHNLLPRRANDPYLTAAKKLGEWIAKNEIGDKLQGFSAGFNGFEKTERNPAGQSTLGYRSTEHNLDLVAFFSHLAATEGRDTEAGQRWTQRREHARTFVAAMFNSDSKNPHLWTGTTGKSAEINQTVIPLDPQSWSVLAIDKQRYEPALLWALANCGAGKGEPGFDFNCKDGDGTWFEGTAQVAAALTWLGQPERAEPILAHLRQAQIRAPEANGALPAASHDFVTTGFTKYDKPWVYDNVPHIGATAWYLFAELGKNPFYLAKVGE